MQHTMQSEADNSPEPRSKFVNASIREPSISESAEENDDASSLASNMQVPKRDKESISEIRKASIAWQHKKTFIVSKGLRKAHVDSRSEESSASSVKYVVQQRDTNENEER